MILLGLLLGVVLAVLAWAGFWTLLSKFVESSGRQHEFENGTLPFEPPSGFYRAAEVPTAFTELWLGKSFDPANRTGIDVFTPKGASVMQTLTPGYRLFQKNAQGNTEAYFFKTDTAPARGTEGSQILRLDYDSPENPFLVRLFLEELTETAPDTFLVKVHVRYFPGRLAAVGFYGLRLPAAGQIAE